MRASHRCKDPVHGELDVIYPRSPMGAAARTRSPSARYAAATPTAPRGPQRAEAPAAFRIPASRVKLRHLRPAAIGHLHPDKTVPRADRDRDRPAAAPDRLCRTLLPNSSLTSRRRHPRTGARDRAPRRRTRGRPAPAPPARPPSRSPGSPAQPSAHPPSPAAPAPGKSPGPPGRMYGNARPTQRLTSSRNTRPARPVRGRPRKADGAHRPSQGPDAVRYMSVDTATQRSTAVQGETWRDREETARIAENSQLAGRFRRWWQVLGSNQRRLSRRFYRPLSLHESKGR
jgi:hypothetical protein